MADGATMNGTWTLFEKSPKLTQRRGDAEKRGENQENAQQEPALPRFGEPCE